MKFLATVLGALLLLSSSGVAFGAVDSSYEKLVMDEIDYNRKMKLLEKQTEVLVRMERAGAPQTTVYSTSNNSFSSFNKNSNSSSFEQKNSVKQ